MPDMSSLSPAGRAIIDHKDTILKAWTSETRAAVAEAKKLSEPILVDTMPALLDNLAEMISPEHPRNTAAGDSTLAHEHGGERARMTEFNPSSVIQEFRILRKVLFRELKQVGPLEEESAHMIHNFIDESIQASATAFSLVQSRLREHVLATLTHDMRSPLTSATLAADIILRKSDDELIRKQARKIRLSNRRIDGMIHDLLNTTMLRSGGKLDLKHEECDCTVLLEEIAEELPSEQASRLKISGNDELKGFWDRGHLKRALENLITNAFKYGDSDSDITLKVCLQSGRVIFSVHNFGPPIPKDEIEAIFQIFRRAEAATSGKRQGWGLGLPIVRAVAEAHGGSLAVDSLKDLGTTFIIDIPQDGRPFGSAPQTE